MSRPSSARADHRPSPDGGFTLIEVVVALFLLGVVATAVVVFFVKGVQTSGKLQRDQSANAVAMQSMETVRSISPQLKNAAGTPVLITGRSNTTVTAFWAAADPGDISGMTKLSDPDAAVWDPNGAAPDPATVPNRKTVTLASSNTNATTVYTVTTLIGQCFRFASPLPGDQPCTNAPGSGVKMFRIVVVVTWKPTNKDQCGGTVCTYRTTALMDPNADASWNLVANPVAYDDAIPVVTGGPAGTYEIMANDVIGAVTSNPVIPLTTPPTDMGTASIITSGAQMGMLIYTPPAGASGVTQLTYKLRDAAGRNSDPATVVISITPDANDDAASIYKGQTSPILVGANDLGTFGGTSHITIVSPPTAGTITGSSGTTVTYAAPAAGTSDSFTYTVTDAAGLTSNQATVNISLLTATPPQSADIPIALNASATTTATNLDILNRTGNEATSTVFVTGGPTASPAVGWSAPGALTGSGSSSLLYSPVGNTVGVYTFTYYVKNAAGTSSGMNIVTLTVNPVATDKSTSVPHRLLGNVNVGTNDIPTTGMTYSLGTPSGAVCSSLTVTMINATTGFVSFRSSADATGTCTIPYSLSKTVPPTTVSATANLIIMVT